MAASRIRVRMRARAIDEPHRASSQLELLFDLTFVVAIAAVTAQFAHSIADGHALDGLTPFLQVFFAIWWAWMNFTWFASSYDTDDVPYRLLTMVQMAGVLVLAAGVPAAADHGDYIGVTSGYLIMRIGLVAQWLRVAAEEPPDRRTALRYAGGISALQVGWFLLLFLVDQGVLSSSAQLLFFVALAILELVVPWWAERTRSTNWHPHHIAERYGLFTIILLGESVLAATAGAQRALEDSEVTWSLIVISAGGLVLLFALWWLYFLQPAGAGLAERRDRSYLWGYGHYGIFASLAALGAGLEVAVEQTGHHLEASPTAVSYAIAIPTGVFLMLVWAVHAPLVETPTIPAAASFAGVFIILLLPLATPWFGVPGTTAATAAVCALLVAVTIGSAPIAREARTAAG
ncbi:low temperature requirement protein LtrA [Kribbella orskensis]|uniref:Low temperature requirement protein LtrA n=1 Tax=Kribbella orskensis TaxID=2512216 RepID=A0ABY2C0I4_9ACTN|nr:low temperature requirement protein A [Kribbella orskensis]TCO32343.1 low temperature requirement protein LtrA [Kribbella orskensis]